MTRPRKKRKIKEPPLFQRFKPAGIKGRDLQQIIIGVDEYEAIRLADYENYDHKRAAKEMDISRPTFSRLIETARKKVAKAIVEGKEIYIEGGSVDFRDNIFRCLDCGEITQLEFNNYTPKNCRRCGSENLINLANRCGFKNHKCSGRRRIRRGQRSHHRKGRF